MIVKKIAIIGPESTGKTELCRALSDHFQAPWIPEYARQYIEQLDHPYTYDDVERIARKQVEELQLATRCSAAYLFVDTDLIITKVWFLHSYNRCPIWLQQAIMDASFDLYLLCKPDIPWEFDPVRENPEIRDFLYDWYRREIQNINKPYAEIGGLGQERLNNALQALALLK